MRLFLVVSLLVFSGATGARAENMKDAAWMLSISSNYGSWQTDDLDSDGAQTLFLTQVTYDTLKWGAAVTGALANTSYKPSYIDERFEVNSLTDTDISTYYIFREKSLTVRFGVDLRLPTGKHSYTDDELTRLITDDISQDLMLVNSYGGGTNVTPHFMVVNKFDKITLGFGAKYDVTGKYDPTDDTPGDNIDPGDRVLAILNGLYRASKNDFIMLSLTYINVGADKMTGDDIFHQGDTYATEIRYLKKLAALTMIASASIRTQEKNKLISDENLLKSEISNSNNNIAEFYLSGVYRYSRKISFTALTGYKEVGANGYNSGDDFYDAGRSKIYVEPGISWYFSSKMYATGKARYTNVKDKSDAASVTNATYDVYNVDLSFVYSF